MPRRISPTADAPRSMSSRRNCHARSVRSNSTCPGNAARSADWGADLPTLPSSVRAMKCTRHCVCLGLAAVLLSGACMLGVSPSSAQQPADGPQPEKRERTIFVPFDALPILMTGPNERVFMTREEYEQLQAEAAKQPPTPAPLSCVVLSAAYEGSLEGSLLQIRGEIALEVLQPGLQAIPLPMQGVAIRRAMLDDASAPLAIAPDGQVMLFVREPGRHRLELQLHSLVSVAAAQQSLQLRLPSAGSATLAIAVPGNVEVKSGASVVRREFDQATDQTRFELVFPDEPLSVVMSLNNRRLRQERVVTARSVMVSELTTAYERLHVTMHMNVLHGAVDRFLFDVPAGFQITGVTSPLLSQWVIRPDGEQTVLEVSLREPIRGTETLSISASRSNVSLADWSMPQLKPREVAGHVAVVGLLAESRLRPLKLHAQQLIHLDTDVLRNALPASVFETEPGAPAIRQIAAYYAPDASFTLTAALEDPQDELKVATHLLLTLSDDQQTLNGGFTLTPQVSKLTSFAFQIPADWQIEQLKWADQSPLKYDRYAADTHTRYVVQLPQSIEPGTSQTIFFQAHFRSSAWLANWDSTVVEFPRVRIERATETSGAIAVQINGDFQAKPESTEGLAPLDAKERIQFGLADSPSELTYQITADDYQVKFLVQRIQPMISARNYSFFQVQDGALIVHYEVVFIVERAHAQQLQIELPASTPTAISIRGLDNVQLKEYSHVVQGETHVWTVLLAKPQIGTVRLAIDYEQRLTDPEPKSLPLPVVHAAGVAYQTQMVSVEGDPALDIEVQTPMRRVDVGELAEAEYTPGRRLLGTFASTAENEPVLISVTRRALRALPPAIVRRAELVSLISADGVCQSSARYLLQTKVPFLAIQFPADTQLWSVTLNGRPIKPRRRGEQILLSLQTEDAAIDRDLQVVFESPISGFGWVGDVRTHAPQLWLASDEVDQGTPVPQVDLQWYVHLPTGYNVSRVRGTVFSSDIQRPKPPLEALAQAASTAGGGMRLNEIVAPTFGAREYDFAAAAPTSEADFEQATAAMEPESRSPSSHVTARSRGDVALNRHSLLAGRRGEPTPQAAAGPWSALGTTQGGEAVRVEVEGEMAQGGYPGMAPGANENMASGQGPGGGSMGYAGGGYPGMGGPAVQAGSGGMMGGGSPGAPPGMPQPPSPTYSEAATGPQTAFGPNGAALAPAADEAGRFMNNDRSSGGQPAMGVAGTQMRPLDGTPPAAQAAVAAGDDALAAIQQRVPLAGGTTAVLSDGTSNTMQLEDQIAPMVGKYWALQGLRGLEIQIDASGEGLAFQSLGTDPELDITVFQQSRVKWLAIAAALAVLVAGILLSRSRLATRVWLVAVIAILACGLPLLGGPATELSEVCEKALLSALILIPIWVLLELLRRTTTWLGRWRSHSTTATASLVLLAVIGSSCFGSPALAQEISDLLKPLLDDVKPVVIPDDAVVIPYDPADVESRKNVSQVLVPYQQYVQLWNLAHPDRKIGPPSADQQFAFAGAQYETTLGDEDQITLQGTLDIELFTDSAVDVPLALQGGIITSALLDGKPARLKAHSVTPVEAAPPQEAQQQVSQPAPPTAALLTLLVEGKGRHQLALSVRVAVTRQGGWHSARGVIPYAAATSVRMTVPAAGTSVRRPLGDATLNEVTESDHQVLETALPAGGQLDVTWRGSIAPGSVDQALTATSAGLIDVREDGIRVVWQVSLTFGQTERGTFTLEIPTDYLVEKVDGKNVRGWETQQVGETTQLTVELLKAVKQNEEMTIHLSRRTAIAAAGADTWTVPYISVLDAALHRGVVQIRRSPILELKTTETVGVTRTDGGTMIQQLEPQLSELQSPLGIRDYQAYEFNKTPFQVTLVASQVEAHVAAQLRTIFRIGETEADLECDIEVSPQRRAIYALDVAIPADLTLDRVTLKVDGALAKGLIDWVRVTVDQRPVLRTFYSAGQAERFTLSLRGKLSDHTANQTLDLPQIEVLGVDEQQGTVAVQVDPSLDARATDLQQCQSVLLDRVVGWLNEEQRPLARLAVAYSNAGYAGKIQVVPREPRVVCTTVSNVRVTYREIQETILLDYRILEAGIRQITFRLPARLKDANILAPRQRQKTVTPVEGEDYVVVQLDLQDAITGDYRVVIENDRAITPGRQTAPLPLIDGGTVNHRYVTLENAGRDEVVVDGTPGMEPVNRPSRQWDQLVARLQGGDFATAYVTSEAGSGAEFGYQTKPRAMVVTAGATIGLARTDLVMDASGAYRASMVLNVDNRTEPYLEIRLPANAQLWAAHVASQPVKPARSAGASDDTLLRIPLIKTAEGDLDYPVVLKYAGKIPSLNMLQNVAFPIIRTENIHIELSQVKLYLPEEYHWYQFDGTATRVQSEDDFTAGYVEYQTRTIEKLTQIMRDSSEFSKSRAAYNVGNLKGKMQQLAQSASSSADGNEALRQNLYSNAQALEAATEETVELEGQKEQVTDNRDRLNYFYQQQQNGLARNSVTRLGDNFRADMPAAQPESKPDQGQNKFNEAWFEQDAKHKAEAPPAQDDESAGGKGVTLSKKRLQSEESYRVQQQMKMLEEGKAGQQVFQVQTLPQSGEEAAEQQDGRGGRGLETKSELNRAYMDKIQRPAKSSLGLTDDSQSMVQGPMQQQAAQPNYQAPAVAFAPMPDLITSTLASQQGRTGLASLDFPLPTRGQHFYFTTPRGEVEITARPLRQELQTRLINLLSLIGMVVGFLAVVALARRLARSRTALISAAVLLAVFGLLMSVLWIFPFFGLAMLFGGIMLGVDAARRRST